MIKKLHEIISRAASRYPDNIAIIEKESRLTYSEVDSKIAEISRSMRMAGLKEGERAGILSRNSTEFILNYFAILRAGGVAVPFNWTNTPAELVRQAKSCAISALCVGPWMENKAQSIIDSADCLKFIVKDGNVSHVSGSKAAKIYEEGLASIIYTAGTTAAARGVMLSHKNLIANNASIVKYMKLKKRDIACCVLPLYYIYGLSIVISHMMAGAGILLENSFAYPNIVLDSIERNRATGFAGVSSHYAILLGYAGQKRKKLSSLRYLMQAGDHMSASLTRRVLKTFPGRKLYIMYGQTEASPRLTYLDPARAAKKPDSVGKPIPGVRIKIESDKGGPCRPFESGEILAKGDNIMLGYLNDSAATSKKLKDGWLHTGDIAHKDGVGDIFLIGRKDGFVKIGGNLVNIEEIEKAAGGCSKVAEAAALAVPDPILGKKIILFVGPVAGTRVTAKKVSGYLKDKLPLHKMPGRIYILKSIPKDDTGKIDRKQLKEFL